MKIGAITGVVLVTLAAAYAVVCYVAAARSPIYVRFEPGPDCSGQNVLDTSTQTVSGHTRCVYEQSWAARLQNPQHLDTHIADAFGESQIDGGDASALTRLQEINYRTKIIDVLGPDQQKVRVLVDRIASDADVTRVYGALASGEVAELSASPSQVVLDFWRESAGQIIKQTIFFEPLANGSLEPVLSTSTVTATTDNAVDGNAQDSGAAIPYRTLHCEAARPVPGNNIPRLRIAIAVDSRILTDLQLPGETVQFIGKSKDKAKAVQGVLRKRLDTLAQVRADLGSVLAQTPTVSPEVTFHLIRSTGSADAAQGLAAAARQLSALNPCEKSKVCSMEVAEAWSGADLAKLIAFLQPGNPCSAGENHLLCQRIAATRAETGADILLFLVATDAMGGGASGIGIDRLAAIGSRSALNAAVSAWRSVDVTPAHELAHLLGSQHEVAADGRNFIFVEGKSTAPTRPFAWFKPKFNIAYAADLVTGIPGDRWIGTASSEANNVLRTPTLSSSGGCGGQMLGGAGFGQDQARVAGMILASYFSDPPKASPIEQARYQCAFDTTNADLEQRFRVARFDFKSATPVGSWPTDDESAQIEAARRAINASGSFVVVHAFTDPRGTAVYNADLAFRRFKFVRTQICEGSSESSAQQSELVRDMCAKVFPCIYGEGVAPSEQADNPASRSVYVTIGREQG